jgi:hypothetical protein
MFWCAYTIASDRSQYDLLYTSIGSQPVFTSPPNPRKAKVQVLADNSMG